MQRVPLDVGDNEVDAGVLEVADEESELRPGMTIRCQVCVWVCGVCGCAHTIHIRPHIEKIIAYMYVSYVSISVNMKTSVYLLAKPCTLRE